MNIDVRIALQNLVWNTLHITIPNHTQLLDEFEELHPDLIPPTLDDVEPFVENHYAKFVEPLPGLVRSHPYDAEKLKEMGFTPEPLFDQEHGEVRYYIDHKTKTYWTPRWGPNQWDGPPHGFNFQGLRMPAKQNGKILVPDLAE